MVRVAMDAKPQEYFENTSVVVSAARMVGNVIRIETPVVSICRC